MKRLNRVLDHFDQQVLARIFPLGLIGVSFLIAIVLGGIGLLCALDHRMQSRAQSMANNLAQHAWTKVSATPLTSRFYPKGNGAYVVRLHVNVTPNCFDVNEGDPEACASDRKIMVVDDDPRGQAFLAIPDGSRVSLKLVDGKRFRSRTMAYNYLLARQYVETPDPTGPRQQ